MPAGEKSAAEALVPEQERAPAPRNKMGAGQESAAEALVPEQEEGAPAWSWVMLSAIPRMESEPFG